MAFMAYCYITGNQKSEFTLRHEFIWTKHTLNILNGMYVKAEQQMVNHL
jgi:hypothetical protein